MKRMVPHSSRVMHFPRQKVINKLKHQNQRKQNGCLFFVVFKSRSSLIYSEVGEKKGRKHCLFVWFFFFRKKNYIFVTECACNHVSLCHVDIQNCCTHLFNSLYISILLLLCTFDLSVGPALSAHQCHLFSKPKYYFSPVLILHLL